MNFTVVVLIAAGVSFLGSMLWLAFRKGPQSGGVNGMKKEETGFGHVIFTCLVFIVWVILGFAMRHHHWHSQAITHIICLSVFLVSFYLMIIRYFAANDKFLSEIDEATAAIFTRGKKLDHVAISYDGHYIDKEYNVKPITGEIAGKKKKFWGGIHYYGIPPLMERLTYNFKWTHRHADGTIKDHSEDISHVLLVPDYYVQRYKKKDSGDNDKKNNIEKGSDTELEDVNGFGIGACLVLPMQIINPVEAILRVKDFLTAIFSLVDPAVVNFVAFFRAKEDLTGMKAGAFDKDDADKNKLEEKWKSVESLKDIKPGDELRGILWNFIVEILEKDTPPNKFHKEKNYVTLYGVKIIKNGTTLTNIVLPETMQIAATAQYIAETEGKAKITEAEMAGKATVIAAKADGDAFDQRVGEPVRKIARLLAGLHVEGDLTTDQILELGKKLPEAWSQYKQTLSIEKLGEQASIVMLPSGQNLGQAIAGGADDAIIREIIRQELVKKTSSPEEKKEEEKK